ncbi:hypothetical protein C8P70_13128 [Myroides indicus]|uniref:Uncharacterized protein n=1 Tax=Myroides indicus TaxID=1323422 RepID=A0A4R7EQ93_9FLAO|nr:hypothetical protein C8P70_13128 [Myroides indicus]
MYSYLQLNTDNLKYYYNIKTPAYYKMPNITMVQNCFIYELNEKVLIHNKTEEAIFFIYKM